MRITRTGAVILVILAACAAGVIVGSGAVQLVAALVGILVLLLLAGEGLGGTGYGGDAARKREVLRRQARPRKAPVVEEPEQPVSGLVSRRSRDPL